MLSCTCQTGLRSTPQTSSGHHTFKTVAYCRSVATTFGSLQACCGDGSHRVAMHACARKLSCCVRQHDSRQTQVSAPDERVRAASDVVPGSNALWCVRKTADPQLVRVHAHCLNNTRVWSHLQDTAQRVRGAYVLVCHLVMRLAAALCRFTCACVYLHANLYKGQCTCRFNYDAC